MHPFINSNNGVNLTSPNKSKMKFADLFTTRTSKIAVISQKNKRPINKGLKREGRTERFKP